MAIFSRFQSNPGLGTKCSAQIEIYSKWSIVINLPMLQKSLEEMIYEYSFRVL